MLSFARLKLVLIFSALFPVFAYAHGLEITATTDFPHTVAASTKTFAEFIVTNTSKKELRAVVENQFPPQSGLSLVSTTCGYILNKNDTCIIELSLDAKLAEYKVETLLKVKEDFQGDIVRYPIHVVVSPQIPQITLKRIHTPFGKPKLPKFREPLIAEYEGKWLILSGSFGDFHDFDNDFNTDIYVYNPKTFELKSMPIDDSNLPEDVKKQLSSTVPVFLQDGETMHIAGGYYNKPNTQKYTTLNTVTIIDVPGMMHAVENGHKNLKQFVAYCSENTQPKCPSYFQVTGGHLGKMGQHLYLAFGQNCEGFYCSTSQTYSNAVFKYKAKPYYHYNKIHFESVAFELHQDDDGSGWRRRDYTLAPFKWHGSEALFALAGPFTPDEFALVWTNGIIIGRNLHSNDNFITQQGNQYASSDLPMYSAALDTSYVATFGSLSNLYWTTQGLEYDNTTPYGNIMDLISADAYGRVREYVNLAPLCSGEPLENCLYMGIGAEFIPVDRYFDERGILELDRLSPHNKTLVGYVYGGLISYSQEPFDPGEQSFATNNLYGVYVQPDTRGEVHWENVTNRFTP